MGNVVDRLVECHSGFTYAERPLAFYWNDCRLVVATIIHQQRTPQGKRFRITAENGQVFDLIYDEHQDIWRVDPA